MRNRGHLQNDSQVCRALPEALDAPSLDLRGPVEIDEFYVSAGLKGRERDRWSRSRGLSRRGRGTYDQDKPPVFVLVDRGTEQRYVVPAKSADESTIRLLLADRQREPLTVYTDGFRAYDPLDEDEQFKREYVVYGDGECADETAHVNTCESHASLARHSETNVLIGNIVRRVTRSRHPCPLWLPATPEN